MRQWIAPARLNDGSMSEPGFGRIGLSYRDRPTITHGGGINGFVAMQSHFPDDGLTVVAPGARFNAHLGVRLRPGDDAGTAEGSIIALPA